MERMRKQQISTSTKKRPTVALQLMALFLPNKDLFTNFAMFNHE